MRAPLLIRLGAIRQLVAFYGVAAVNTAFGYSLYAALVFAGLNPFVAQIASHLAGMTFNYFMYQRHVFNGSKAAVERYVLAYGVNYLLGLGFLAVFQRLLGNAYASGFAAMLGASLVNFVVLKRFVFRDRRETAPAASCSATER